ncbi:hypothetical protein Tco_0870060 [Tanacetum coccineum]
MLFTDLLLIKYKNSKIDNTVRARRCIEWCDKNNIPLDYGSTSVPHHALAPERILNRSNQEDPTLNIKSYFSNSLPVHRGTLYSWHDDGCEEEERWESGLDENITTHLNQEIDNPPWIVDK